MNCINKRGGEEWRRSLAKVVRAGSREIYSVRQMLSKLQHDFDPNTSMSTKRSNCQSPHTRTRTAHAHTHTLKETKRILSSIVIFHFETTTTTAKRVNNFYVSTRIICVANTKQNKQRNGPRGGDETRQKLCQRWRTKKVQKRRKQRQAAY